jgi:lipoprotein-anchoring transpeptidase ErfK/SrfK
MERSKPSPLSRRDFLRQAGGALAALALPPFPDADWSPPLRPDDLTSLIDQSLGRVTTPRLEVRAAPDRSAEITGYRVFDQLIILYRTAEGPGELAHNPIWFKISGGYVHSSAVQPVERRLNRPLPPRQVSPESPALLEVTVPYSDVYRQPSAAEAQVYRLYYATTHWAVAVERGATRKSWYKLRNDRGHGHYYARAEHLRPITPDELTPLSPGVRDKRIEISLKEQSLTAYEGEKTVKIARVATGAVFREDNGVSSDLTTPVGSFRVVRKRASRHMESGAPGAGGYNLPGVPWVTYFTWTGVALHGTYWHNDYGQPRSHGCVNMRPEDARWLYRWTEPEVPAEEEVLVGAGTPIQVVG